MGLIADVLGSLRPGGKKAPRTIAAVEAALGRLADERTAAREAVARAMRDRDDLLLVDETDRKITELDASADRYRLTLERCDKAEPLLLAELQELKTAAKRAEWAKLRERYDAAAIEHASAMRAAVATAAVMLDLNTEARSAGFEHETAAAFIPPARMLSVESLNQYEFAIERARELSRPVAPAVVAMPQPKPVAVAPKQAAKPTPAPVAVAPKPPPKPFKLPEPDSDGNIKIVVIKPGIEIEGRPRPKAGETVAVPAATAMRIVQSGHADFAA